jgi:hypothetical protein
MERKEDAQKMHRIVEPCIHTNEPCGWCFEEPSNGSPLINFPQSRNSQMSLSHSRAWSLKWLHSSFQRLSDETDDEFCPSNCVSGLSHCDTNVKGNRVVESNVHRLQALMNFQHVISELCVSITLVEGRSICLDCLQSATSRPDLKSPELLLLRANVFHSGRASAGLYIAPKN